MKLYNTPKQRRKLAIDLAETIFEDQFLMEDIGAMLSRDGRQLFKQVAVKEGLLEDGLDLSSDTEYTLAEIFQKLRHA